MSDRFPRLLSPLRIGQARLPNRIVSTAHVTRMGERNLPTRRHVEYYRRKAHGGAGLIVTEALRVHPTSIASGAALAGCDPRIVPWLRRIADAVHGEGAPVVAQALHNGRQHSPYWTGLPLWAPSPVPGYHNHETPHEMSEAEIREVIDGFAVTAGHVAASGYDGVEIHAAHGYLLQQFMSPVSNRRSDRYGGALSNRLRLVREVIAAVRAAAPRLVLGLRVSGSEFTPGGLDIGDMCEIVPLLVERGEVDYVSVSQSNYEGTSLATMVPDLHFAPAAFAHLARDIKRAVPGVPVLAVGRIGTPELAERVLADTGVDLVGMNRATIADPDLPRKAELGETGRIRPCIALNVCWGGAAQGSPFRCAVNPAAGLERGLEEETPPRARRPRRVVVVGAGPAGLEAARTAAASGHRVVLLEREAAAGGQLRLAARAPGRAELMGLVEWAVRELARLGVEVRTGVEARAETVLALEPDAVVVACGSAPSRGGLDGAAGTVVSGRDVLAGATPAGARALVVDREWAWQAPGIAEHLHAQGLGVELATEKLGIGVLLPANVLPTLHARLDERGIPVRTLLRVVATSPHATTFQHALTLRTWTGDGYDAVVVAGESRADDALYRALRERHPRVLAAGDCVAPRQILDAMREGRLAGLRVG